MKLELFMSPTCHKCAMTTAIRRKLLAERGLKYEEIVVELDVTNIHPPSIGSPSWA